MPMSRGLRNNNPLNIRHSADCWQGARKDQTDKSFVQFESMAYGYRAAWKTLQTYYYRLCGQGQPFNVQHIISRWAPPEENDTSAYIRFVVGASRLGGKENLLPPSNVAGYGKLSRLMAAMTCMECGIPYAQVDTEAICKGYRLAFPENNEELNKCLDGWDEYAAW